jgi:hypothetical protein
MHAHSGCTFGFVGQGLASDDAFLLVVNDLDALCIECPL